MQGKVGSTTKADMVVAILPHIDLHIHEIAFADDPLAHVTRIRSSKAHVSTALMAHGGQMRYNIQAS